MTTALILTAYTLLASLVVVLHGLWLKRNLRLFREAKERELEMHREALRLIAVAQIQRMQESADELTKQFQSKHL